jgi:hypothetical protein
MTILKIILNVIIIAIHFYHICIIILVECVIHTTMFNINVDVVYI